MYKSEGEEWMWRVEEGTAYLGRALANRMRVLCFELFILVRKRKDRQMCDIQRKGPRHENSEKMIKVVVKKERCKRRGFDL